MERPLLRRQLVMIFLGIAIPIGILLGLLLFFSGLYSRNRLAAAASGGLDMFTTNFENQLDSVENYLLNLSLNDAAFRSLSEQTDRTRAYLDAYEIAQGFPAVLAANDTLMGVVLRSGSGNLYVGRYGAAAQQLKQKLNLEAYLGQPGQTNKMMTKGWYLRTIGQRLYLLRSVFYQKASLTAAVDLRLVFEELVENYGLDGRVVVMNDSGNVLVGDANLLPTKMEWNSEGYCLTKVGRDSRLVVRKQVKELTVLYLVPYQHFGVDFAPYQILLVMGAVFVLLAIPFLMFYMKQEIFAPMTALVSTMDRIGRGELSVRSSVDYRNAEFTQVNETFNRMIDQITQLKIDGYEKELEARRNEMTALKLQIRPHFVLNCLKSVYAMVQTGSREDAQQLILLLSRYLRYILSFTATTTPLHTEIEQCCNYAELSSVGQNDPVEVVCEIDPELSELPLPPVSALDVSIQAQILNLLMDLQDEKKLTYVFITHDLSVVKHISHEIMVMYLGQCVEYAKTEDLFKNPLHPYTKGLLDAVPIPSLKAKKLSTEVMRGELTSPVDPAPGCRFAARCPYATDACRGRDIPLKEVEPGHFVSCTHF